MTFTTIDLNPLFSTPFVRASLDNAASIDLNRQLTEIILKKAHESRGVFISNSQGWQSDDRLIEWGGQPVQIILDALRELVNQITMCVAGEQYRRVALDWRINGWANINREGNSNVPHVHPGAYWSAVYYVSTNAVNGKGGELELFDPRGAVPVMYRPWLCIGMQDYASAGTSRFHTPKAGQCVIFPSWVKHAVRPFVGEGIRISLAFNFAIH